MPNKCSLSAVLMILATLMGCAGPRIQPSLPEDRVPILHETDAVMSDGYVLPLSVWRPAGEARAVVLALHGMNDYRHAFADVGVHLAAAGIVTYAYDQRGFGETRWRGVWAGTERLIRDMETMAALIHARYPDRPLYLMGESMGGAVLLASLHNDPELPNVSGMVLIAPAVWGRETMNPFQRVLLWLGVHTMPSLELTGDGLDITPSDNVAMLRALGSDPLVIKKTRIDVLDGVVDLMDEALASAPSLHGPALVLYGAKDEIIPKRPACRMFAMLPESAARHPRIVIYPEGYHMLTRDLQGEVVLQDITAWISDGNDSRLPEESAAKVIMAAAEFCGGKK
jgi:acylglycerol lipase